MTQLLERAFQKAQALPPAEQDRIAQKLLEEIESGKHPLLRKSRMPGLGKGTVEMAEDFDAPLPDSFWLGEE